MGTDQEAAVDAGREQVLGGVARDGPVVPRVLLERVDRRHVVAGHPAHAAGQRVRLAPLAALVVALDAHLLACATKSTAHYCATQRSRRQNRTITRFDGNVSVCFSGVC